MDITGKVVIVTAGCSGIGASITRYLLEKGCKVIATTRNIDHAKAFFNTLNKDNVQNCYPAELSLETQESINSFVESMIEKYEKIDGLVNCAVCREPLEDYYEMDIEKWDRHYRINVFATAHISAKVAELLIKENGSIINISSFYSVNVPDNRVYDKGTIPTSLIYASSKAAVNYITQYMAVRYAKKNIAVNAILAGGVENKERQSEYFVKEYCKRTPMNRMAQADEFNNAIEFFLSNDNRFCTGQLLSIDGGWGLL